jgi:hypothetical protein
MRRLSPITLSLVAIMVAVLGATVFLLAHSQRHGEPVSEPETVAAKPVPPPPPAPVPEPVPSPPSPPPPPPAVPAVAVVETPAEADAQEPAEDQPQALPGRRGLLVVNHNRRLQEADENVFATLALPESTRASIRQINEEYRKRTESSSDAAAGGPSASFDALAALKTRHDGLTSLLGADASKSFDAEERIAVMRLRGKYRYEWGRQLRQ